ncbi:ATP-binding protein [Candidatus Pacearchaeota archaeon]|nr:ATP-binding protein [Candidatus Pacearchaeota archaeon]
MAKYIHTPEDREFGKDTEDWIFLNEHLGHDFGTVLHGLSGYIDEGIRGETIILNDFSEMKILNEHINRIYDAIKFGYQKIAKENFSIKKILQLNKEMLSKRELCVLIQDTPKIICYNIKNKIYLQYFNFVKNAYEHGFKNSQVPYEEKKIILGAEVFPISEEQLTYLGRNHNLYRVGEDFVRAYVKDNGCGIPEENLEKVFKRKPSTSERGVGLSLIDWVCDSIHGYASVESEVGKGSEFSLYFARERK